MRLRASSSLSGINVIISKRYKLYRTSLDQAKFGDVVLAKSIREVSHCPFDSFLDSMSPILKSSKSFLLSYTPE
jgi:hypothetical protein